MIVFCVLQIFVQIMILNYIRTLHTSTLAYHRYAHLLLATIILLTLFMFKHFWTSKRCSIVFLLFYIHIAYFGWRSELLLSQTPAWTPFSSFKLQMIVLAFLVPGPYLLNLMLMVCLGAIAVIQWFYLSIGTSPNAILTIEPYASLIYAGVSLALIGFRYRDQKLIEKLSRQGERDEVSKKVTSAMLSMKDKLNTPIQCQILAVEMLKKSGQIKPDLLKSLENSTNKIVGVTRMIDRIEKEYPSLSTDLMTEEELSEFLSRIENENAKSNEF